MTPPVQPQFPFTPLPAPQMPQPQYAPPPQAPVAPPPQPPGPAFVDPNMRVQQGDQRFPPELWGKTMVEALRMWNVMKEDFLQRNVRQPQQPQPQQPQPQQLQQPQRPQQPQYPSVPRYQDPPQTPQQTPEDVMRQAVREVLASEMPTYLAPMTQATAQSVYTSVRSEFPDWNQYDQEILNAARAASQADPSSLVNPEFWRAAYYHTKGRALSQPGGQAPQGGAPPSDPFFTESPTAPVLRQQNGEPSANDPRVLAMAARFGISPEEYLQWWAGKVPPPPAPTQPAGGSNGYR